MFTIYVIAHGYLILTSIDYFSQNIATVTFLYSLVKIVELRHIYQHSLSVTTQYKISVPHNLS